MVEGINLWHGPSVCITAEIIAVVGCQRAGSHTASSPSRADFALNESGRRSRETQPDRVFITRKSCQSQVTKPPPWTTRRPRGRLGIARYHVYRHDTRRREDAITVSHTFWGVGVLSPKPLP
jgi:hypothetical protein